MDPTTEALLKKVETLGQELAKDGSLKKKIELQTAVRKLGIELESEGDIADRICYSPAGVVAIRVAVDLGIFEILVKSDGPKTAQDLAKEVGAEYELLARIMRNLVAIDAVEEVGAEEYKASKVSRAFAQPKGSCGAKFFINFLYPMWMNLPKVLAEDHYKNPVNPMKCAAQLAHKDDRHVFQILMDQPQEFGNFLTFMSAQREGRQGWLDFYPVEKQMIEGFKGEYVFVDVGGAGGHECHALKGKYPHLPGKLVLQDLPDTIERVKGTEAPGMEAMVHDFFTPQPIKQARAYYLRNVLHDWSNDSCTHILKNLAAVMEPRYSKVLINETVVPLKGASLFTVQSDLNMMSSLAGMERTESQWHDLLKSAGLKIEKIWGGEGDSESLIEAMLA